MRPLLRLRQSRGKRRVLELEGAPAPAQLALACPCGGEYIIRAAPLMEPETQPEEAPPARETRPSFAHRWGPRLARFGRFLWARKPELGLFLLGVLVRLSMAWSYDCDWSYDSIWHWKVVEWMLAHRAI